MSDYHQAGFTAVMLPYYQVGYRAARRLLRQVMSPVAISPPEEVPSSFLLKNQRCATAPNGSTAPEHEDEAVRKLAISITDTFFSLSVIDPAIAVRLADRLLNQTKKASSLRRQFFEMTLDAIKVGVNPFFAHAQAIQLNSVERRMDEELPIAQTHRRRSLRGAQCPSKTWFYRRALSGLRAPASLGGPRAGAAHGA